VGTLKNNVYRFVTAPVLNWGWYLDVINHYERIGIKKFKGNIKKEDELPSISNIYFSAILVKNERVVWIKN
jgi:hypothetical protein